ncbi:uncharacterized protein LOC134574724 [Pelobates fuscus]|uniref:uncharacterized protein LOC134574724 n=1 Tax=Pelobates fuscus TaxID=191477 RepID=UPI002FE44CCA
MSSPYRSRSNSPAVPRRDQAGRSRRLLGAPVSEMADGGTATPRPAAARGISGWKVWIWGHSYVYWAQKRAAVRRSGAQLGFTQGEVSISWFGFRGFSWQSLSSLLFSRLAGGSAPDIVLLHGGGNDLGLIPQRELVRRMKRDVDRLLDLVPGVVVVWSEMVPRFTWRHARDPAAVARCRGKVNRAMASFVRRLGGLNLQDSLQY